MLKLNWEIVNDNIVEAREQLEEVERQIASEDISEGSFKVMIEHAFHHLNFAWNVRQLSSEQYVRMNDADFNAWGVFRQISS
jgi:hypothetical protein